MKYQKITYPNNKWIICEKDLNIEKPKQTYTFTFDTETFLYLDGKKLSQNEVLEKLKGIDISEIRKRVTTNVWCWQIYDEYNGFFMTNDFYKFLNYICLCQYKFGWCYNAKFDFAQIDYKILAGKKDLWKPHNEDKASKGQPWTFSSIHNDMGARYCYKLWVPYKRKGKDQNRHTRTHSFDFRDFMNFFQGGLKRLLEDLDVEDNTGNKIRKLTMEYQAVDTNNLTDDEIDYCVNDVKGLYFAVKKFNESIEEQSNGECHIFGKDTNLMTAGGFAKSELLRTLYPDIETKKKRLKHFQKVHPITEEQDRYFRQNHLYRGGICLVNEIHRGIMYKEKNGHYLNRYDVNSEYPYAMSVMPDLIGKPQKISVTEWQNVDKSKYECILAFSSITGELKAGYIPVWFNPFQKKYVSIINETGIHLMFEREFEEYLKWYDLEYVIDYVIIIKKGDCIYKKFVEDNYKLKNEAGKAGNKSLKANAKLKLNSSYGKLAERIERNNGHYELNEETGAVHFITDGVETDESGAMNVIIGSLVTAIARIWILSHIREICGQNMINNFFYIDTDSIHTTATYEKADPYSLGGFKLEAQCKAWKYIAPKTYIDIEEIENGKVTKFEPHTKGINISAVLKDFNKQDLTIEYIDKRFNYGEQFDCLTALNVKGGKALVPIYKYLARPELTPAGLVQTGLDNITMEI